MPTEPDDVFKALADPTRRALLERLLREGRELNVRALTAQAGVSQPMVSKHLNVLKAAGLVQERPDGRVVHYRAEPKGLAPLMDWMRFYAVFWDERMDRLENLLNRMDQ
ncbi:MAG TPA: metalloregulator ArsR/SmtB family transcription factor [Burkholderiaceae bacterium]